MRLGLREGQGSRVYVYAVSPVPETCLLGVLDVWNVYACVVNNPMPLLPILMQEVLLLEKSLILQNQHFGG